MDTDTDTDTRPCLASSSLVCSCTVYTHSTIWVIESRLLPTLVPPNFWTTQGTLSSAELRTRSSSTPCVGVAVPERAKGMVVVVLCTRVDFG